MRCQARISPAIINALAAEAGWQRCAVFESNHITTGWPDFVFVRARRILFGYNRPSEPTTPPPVIRTSKALRKCSTTATAAWRPEDEPAIRKTMEQGQQRTSARCLAKNAIPRFRRNVQQLAHDLGWLCYANHPGGEQDPPAPALTLLRPPTILFVWFERNRPDAGAAARLLDGRDKITVAVWRPELQARIADDFV